MIGWNSVAAQTGAFSSSTMAGISQRTALQITTGIADQGPGFSGIDVDGDGGVSYEEYWIAAQSVRNSGVATITQSTGQRAFYAQATQQSEDLAMLELTDALDEIDFDESLGDEYARVMWEIDNAKHANGFLRTDEGTVVTSYQFKRTDAVTAFLADSAISIEVSRSGGGQPSDYEAAELHEQLMSAVFGPDDDEDLTPEDAYERALDEIFVLADRDGDGVIDEDEFNFVNETLFGDGRTVEQTMTITAEQSYAMMEQINLAAVMVSNTTVA